MKILGLVILVGALASAGCGESEVADERIDEPSEIVDESETTEDSTGEAEEDSGEIPEDSDTGGGNSGPPEDNYACTINSAGFCIFTGTAHQTGLEPGTTNILNRDGDFLFSLQEAVSANASGQVLVAKGTPAFDGDDMIASAHDDLSEDEIAFHRVMATMFPIRNALMYDIGELTQAQWDDLVAELEARGVKDTTFTDGATPRDNYYGRQGVFELAKNPDGRDIHHDVMKFLEESGLYFLCHVTSAAFSQMLADTHPEGHDPCEDAGIASKIPF